MPKFTPTADELHALEVVFEMAEGHSGTGLRMRRLLCSWWNAPELGGFHLSDLWQLDAIRLAAAIRVITMIARAPGGTYADSIEGFGERMRAIAKRHSRELELGAKFTFEQYDEMNDWTSFQPDHIAIRYDTRAEAERDQYSLARQAGLKREDLRVVPVWDDDDA